MTNQETARETAIRDLMDYKKFDRAPTEGIVDCVLGSLDACDVVIKVEGELPMPQWDEVKDTALEVSSEDWSKMLAIMEIIITKGRRAGYEATVPLIEEK